MVLGRTEDGIDPVRFAAERFVMRDPSPKKLFAVIEDAPVIYPSGPVS